MPLQPHIPLSYLLFLDMYRPWGLSQGSSSPSTFELAKVRPT